MNQWMEIHTCFSLSLSLPLFSRPLLLLSSFSLSLFLSLSVLQINRSKLIEMWFLNTVTQEVLWKTCYIPFQSWNSVFLPLFSCLSVYILVSFLTPHTHTSSKFLCYALCTSDLCYVWSCARHSVLEGLCHTPCGCRAHCGLAVPPLEVMHGHPAWTGQAFQLSFVFLFDCFALWRVSWPLLWNGESIHVTGSSWALEKYGQQISKWDPIWKRQMEHLEKCQNGQYSGWWQATMASELEIQAAAMCWSRKQPEVYPECWVQDCAVLRFHLDWEICMEIRWNLGWKWKEKS